MKIPLALATTLLVVSCTTSSPSDYARQNGEKLLMDSGSYSALITRYQTELQKEPSAEVRHKLANVHYLMGDPEAAMFQLSQIPPKARNTAELALLRANVFFDQGKMPSAEQYTNAAIRIDNKLGEAHNLRGLILAGKGQLAEAKVAFESARQFHFDDATVKNNLAMIAMLQGDFDQAIDILMPLVQSGRADDTAKANLVLAFAKAGRTRAFSQMLAGSENDIHLAEKFQSLNSAKIHHSQLTPTTTLTNLTQSTAGLSTIAKVPSSSPNNAPSSTIAKAPSSNLVKAMHSAQPKHGVEKGIKPVLEAKPEKTQPKPLALKAINTAANQDIASQIEKTKEHARDPLTLARERVKAAKEKKAKQVVELAAAAKAKEIAEAKAKKRKTSSKKRSRKLITAMQYQPVTANGSGNEQYVATADFELGKVRTMFLEKRKKWVFDVRGAKDFTIKRKQYLKEGPAKMIELGEHKNYVRIVLTLRDGAKGKPVVAVDGNTLTIRWEA
ncbi:hypothetical protein [Enterovibrio calviensis]|uniref:hypothetical protein n=1 Tax=Enterovibrio calviensis TaxID=91359 RepID=UPI003735CD48